MTEWRFIFIKSIKLTHYNQMKYRRYIIYGFVFDSRIMLIKINKTEYSVLWQWMKKKNILDQLWSGKFNQSQTDAQNSSSYYSQMSPPNIKYVCGCCCCCFLVLCFVQMLSKAKQKNPRNTHTHFKQCNMPKFMPLKCYFPLGSSLMFYSQPHIYGHVMEYWWSEKHYIHSKNVSNSISYFYKI